MTGVLQNGERERLRDASCRHSAHPLAYARRSVSCGAFDGES